MNKGMATFVPGEMPQAFKWDATFRDLDATEVKAVPQQGSDEPLYVGDIGGNKEISLTLNTADDASAYATNIYLKAFRESIRKGIPVMVTTIIAQFSGKFGVWWQVEEVESAGKEILSGTWNNYASRKAVGEFNEPYNEHPQDGSDYETLDDDDNDYLNTKLM